MLHKRFLLIPILAIGLVACESEEDRERPERLRSQGANGEVAPPMPGEIAAQIVSEAQLDAPVPPPGSTFPPILRQNMLQVLQRSKVQHSQTEEGQQALAIVANAVDKRVRTMERAQLWEHTVAYTDAHLIFRPGSTKFNHVRDKALLELRKPRVTVKGLPVLNGKQVVVLSVYLPMTSQTFRENLLIGEEIHGLKLLSIFGENRGVRLEFLETGERFVAYLPAAL